MTIGAFKVALYAEGAGETLKGPHSSVPPGEILPEDELGAGHVLIRRLLSQDLSLPPGAVRFVRPLRLRDREARGSDLLDDRAVSRLVNWPMPTRRPTCSVLLVDSDGRPGRHPLEFRDCIPPAYRGVAAKEFEAWLIADQVGVQQAMAGATFEMTRAPEDLLPGEAKALLAQALGGVSSGSHEEAKGLRRTISELMDLDRAAARSNSFRTFREGLSRFARSLPS